MPDADSTPLRRGLSSPGFGAGCLRHADPTNATGERHEANNSLTATLFVEAPLNTVEAEDDAASTLKDTPVIADVLANDHRPPGTTLRVSSVSTTAGGGTAVITPDGLAVEHTPPSGFEDVGSFTYEVTAS
jgi:large repetitive protein